MTSEGAAKNLLIRRFKQAQQSYDDHAVAQQLITKRLFELLVNETTSVRMNDVLEFGCGTGDYTLQLIKGLPIQTLVLNDLTPLAPQLKQQLLDIPYQYEQGDIEQLNLGKAKWDLITASSAVQWLHDLPTFISRCHLALKPGGVLALSTFLPENLHQVRHTTGIGLNYWGKQDWINALAAGFEIKTHTEEVTLDFDSPLEVLKHLKATGVNAIQKSHWTPGDFKTFEQRYRMCFTQASGKVSLTYTPLYIIATKK